MRSGGEPRAARKCEGCGARVRTEAKFCEYCGAELPALDAPAPVAPSRFGDLEARFKALDRHRDTRELMRRAPPTTGPVKGMVAGLAFGLFFAGFAIFFISMTSSFDRRFEESRRAFDEKFPGGSALPGRRSEPDMNLFKIIPGVFVCVGAGIALFSLVRILRFANAPLEREPALVAGERTQITSQGGGRSARTGYFVTLEYEDGRRREYRTRGQVTGEVAEGDIGIAYVKGEHLLDFARVPV